MNSLAVLAAPKTADWIFGGILSLLTLTLILLVAALLRRRAARKRAEAAPRPAETPVTAAYPPAPARPAAPAEPRENLMGSLAREEEPEQTEPVPEERPLDDKTIDKHYAEHRGQWICPYCETINDRGLVLCQACGQPRSGS